MIKQLENINTFILSKMLLKIIAFCLSCFIIFNCIFSSISANIDSDDLSKFSSIQRDVFSAVFFVSNSIGKINFSLTSEIITNKTNTRHTYPTKEQNKNVPNKNNDFIITCLQAQGEFLKLQSVQTSSLFNHSTLSYDYGCLFNEFYNLFKNIVCVFIIFLFFASIKKLYDSILKLNINRKNPAFMHV